jgi:hypothetical protein
MLLGVPGVLEVPLKFDVNKFVGVVFVEVLKFGVLLPPPPPPVAL